eukprot:6865841-Prymnesium_polylepis.1
MERGPSPMTTLASSSSMLTQAVSLDRGLHANSGLGVLCAQRASRLSRAPPSIKHPHPTSPKRHVAMDASSTLTGWFGGLARSSVFPSDSVGSRTSLLRQEP